MNPRERGAKEEHAALFFAIAGSVIQKLSPRPDEGVACRKLFKVLANCLWDWACLPLLDDGKRFGIGPVQVLKWIPHRFGALGVVAPEVEYYVKKEFGMFVGPHDVIRCGVFADYGIQLVPRKGAGGPRLLFPTSISVPQRKQTGVPWEDWTYWEILCVLYGSLADDLLNALASCRTSTAAFHSLWVQFVFWRDDSLAVASRLQDHPDPFGHKETREAVELRLQNCNAAAANFTKKIQYWTRIADHHTTAAARFAPSEFKDYAPVRIENGACPFSQRLSDLLDLEPVIHAANLLLQGPCKECGFDTTSRSITEAEAALDVLNARLGSALMGFNALSKLWYGRELRNVADYIFELVDAVDHIASAKLGLRVLSPREHYRDFVRVHYPIPPPTTIPATAAR